MLVATILVSVTVIIASLLGARRWAAHTPPKLWARLWCRIMFVTVTLDGRENIDTRTSYVFVANHQGAYDIFAIYGYLPHGFLWMMKKSLFNIPFVGWACHAAGHIKVDRSSAKQVKHTMDVAKSRLKDGTSIVVFPEGSRTWDGRMRPFKRGAFKLAADFQLPIVPITIDGAFDVMPRSGYSINPGTIRLTIHKPIHLDGTHEGLAEAMRQSYSDIQSALPAHLRDAATDSTAPASETEK